MLEREPCRESLEEMTEPFVGGKKERCLLSPEKGFDFQVSCLVSPSPSSLFRSITLSDNHARLFRAFRHPLLFTSAIALAVRGVTA